MGSIHTLGAKALALRDAANGCVSVRVANPGNETERGLEMVFPDFVAAQEYADYLIDRCGGFYRGIIDMTGEAND